MTRPDRQLKFHTTAYVIVWVLIVGSMFVAYLQQKRLFALQGKAAEVVNMVERQSTTAQRMATTAGHILYLTMVAEAQEKSAATEEQAAAGGDAPPAVEEAQEKEEASQPAGSPHADRKALREMAESLVTTHEYVREQVMAGKPVLRDEIAFLYADGTDSLDKMAARYAQLGQTVARKETAAEMEPAQREMMVLARSGFPARMSELSYVLQENFNQQHYNISTRISTMMALVISLLALQALGIFMPLHQLVKKQAEALDKLNRHDPLTGCFNRRSLFETASVLLGLAHRNNQPISAILLEIDDFRTFNEAHGVAAGDEAIRSIVRQIQETVRISDVVGRMGGDEFAVFLPNANEEQAALVAEKIRKNIWQTPVQMGDKEYKLTASFGVAGIANENIRYPAEVLAMTERALREAKQFGRNCVIRYGSVAEADAPGDDHGGERNEGVLESNIEDIK